MSDLIADFLAFAATHNMRVKERRTLIAVSGGVDSIVLCDLFYRSGYRFGIAHCNFQLRGAAADEDEEFCRAIAQKYKVPFFSIKFETAEFAEKEKLSIQEAARKLRYEWFMAIQQKEKYYYLATAHHANDNAETILYNIIKGTGVKGLRGILPKKDTLIRPLLFAEKNQLIQYQQACGLDFREDSSNKEDKYSRNKIRLHIIPEIEKINPAFVHTVTAAATNFLQLEQIESAVVKKQEKKVISQNNGKTYFSIKALLAIKNPTQFLLHQLSPFGFTFSQCENIYATLRHPETKFFYTTAFRLVKGRHSLLLEENNSPTSVYIAIPNAPALLKINQKTLQLNIVENNATAIQKKENNAQIDLAKIQFPLVVRSVKMGDYFYPIGMNGKKKKVSKFLKDIKLNQQEKENILVMESAGKIVWVIGYRIDERYKLTATTQQVLQINYH